jgi:hypothetical protein
VEIEVANNSSTGIAAAEIDNGADKVAIAVRIGESAKDLTIMGEPIHQDTGMIRIALR